VSSASALGDVTEADVVVAAVPSLASSGTVFKTETDKVGTASCGASGAASGTVGALSRLPAASTGEVGWLERAGSDCTGAASFMFLPVGAAASWAWSRASALLRFFGAFASKNPGSPLSFEHCRTSSAMLIASVLRKEEFGRGNASVDRTESQELLAPTSPDPDRPLEDLCEPRPSGCAPNILRILTNHFMVRYLSGAAHAQILQ